MKPPPDIETERLLLRFPEPAEAPAVLHFFESNRAHLEPWSPTPPNNYYTVQFWEGRLYQNVIEHDNEQSARFFIFTEPHPERVIGTCNLNNIVRGAFHAAYLGYSLDQAHLGLGYMSEAVDAVVEFAFRELNLHRVMANYIPENEKSGAVLARCGFEREGIAQAYLRIDGAWRDHVLTSRHNPEWHT